MLTFEKDSKKGYRLYAERMVDLPLKVVFDFFSDARQLEAITPPWLNFSILNPPPIEMRAGLLLDYKLSLRGIPLKWQSEISVWEPPLRFVDQQTKGPYRFWQHEHLLDEVDGKTRVRDNVHYDPRGGALVHRLLVRPDLKRIFTYRQTALGEIFAKLALEKDENDNQDEHDSRQNCSV
jgi:ligand-binding SRPBCC domain-containing protein